MKKHILGIALLSVIGLAACQPNIHPQADPSATVTVSSEKGKLTYTFTANDRWSLVNDNDWIYVSPTAGLAGEAKITVSFEENATMKDRSGAFYILDGARTLKYSFFQPSIEIISTDNDVYYVPEEGNFTVRVKSNIDFTVSSDTDWIILPENTSFKGNGIEEGLVFALKSNSKTVSREGHLTFTTVDGNALTVTVIQAAHVDVDWNLDFYRGILGYRFTGDWCGFCPYLAYDIQKFSKEQPGRLNCICFYDSNSNASLMYNESAKYEKRFAVTGKPTLTLDERGFAYNIASPTFYNIIKAFSEEEKASYKAETAISAQVSFSDGKVEVHPTVYAKKAATYHLHIALLESGIVVAQTDYTNLYSAAELASFAHNNVVRAYATTLLTGDEFTTAKRSINSFNYTIKLPANIKDSSKLSVAVYVTRESVSGPQTVEKLTYYRDHVEFVDNSIIVPVGQSSTLKYEVK